MGGVYTKVFFFLLGRPAMHNRMVRERVTDGKRMRTQNINLKSPVAKDSLDIYYLSDNSRVKQEIEMVGQRPYFLNQLEERIKQVSPLNVNHLKQNFKI